MNTWVDNAWLTPAFIISVVIFAACAIVGLKRGFIKTVFDFCGMFVAVILTVLISPYVAALMRNNASIYDAFNSKIAEHVHVNFDAGNNRLDDYLEGLKLPSKVENYVLEGNDAVSQAVDNAVENVNKAIVDRLTDMAINCVAFIITFVILLVIIAIVSMVLDLVAKLPVLNTANKTLGLIAGLIEAYLILSILGVILMALSTSELGISISSQVAANPVLSFIYKHNLILMGITKFRGMLK
ncbi:MAG: CvpA family protein [Lachnospiraceae bacterium]|nr:CvpA family protein [Lachnospiraceae bacterium]